MAISSISFSTPPPPPVEVTPLSHQPVNREIASAVHVLNENGTAGEGRQFSIAIDSKTKVPVVRIVDSNTNELIEQIPSQYALDLAQQISQETASTASSSGR